MNSAKVLDSGKFAFEPSNWVETEGESFQLFVDGKYIATIQPVVTLDKQVTLIVVATLHAVKLKGDA